jgi:MFS family permease
MNDASTEPDSAGGGSLPLSRNKNFLCFAVLRFTNSAALQMLNVAVGWQIYEMTGNPLDLGFVGLAQFAPVLVLFLIAGVVSDRFSRRMIAIVTNLVHAATAVLFLAYAFSGGQSALPIFALLVVHGAARSFFQPTANALLANIVPRDRFAAAIAASSSVLKAGFMVGPALGGILIAVIGLWVYLVVAIGFAIAGLAAIPIVVATTRRVTQRIDLETVLGGFTFITEKKILLGAITLDLLAVLFSGIMGMLPVFAKDILHVGPEGLGIMRTTPAVGSLIVGLLLTRIPAARHMGPTLFISTIILGASTIAFSLSTVFWFSVLMLAIWGGTDMLSVYIRQTIMQLATPDEMRGRVNSVSSVAINASNELGDFRAGLMAAWITTVPAVLVGGAVTIVVTGLWWRLFPDLRNVDRVSDL